jgi:NDP-mannose synthase
MRAIILAGGKGSRLLPYTTILPKPLMPIGEQPIVEILLRQLRHYGYNRITLALGHLAHLVQAVLGNGEKLGTRIDYSIEDVPLGTSGPISMVKDLNDTFLVLNGDVLTDMNFADLLTFHRQNKSVLTIASHRRRVDIDYGVIHRNGFNVVRYEEKPVINYEVSMGIYVFEPSVLHHISRASYLDFPDLVRMLLEKEEKVSSYPYDGIWYDLGRVADFQQAQDLLGTLKKSIPFFGEGTKLS